MKIRRIRIVLPSRLRSEALGAARLTGIAIAQSLLREPSGQNSCVARVAGRGQPAAMLARAAGTAVATALGQGRR